MSDNNFDKTGLYPNPTVTSEPMRAPPIYQHGNYTYIFLNI